MATNLSDTESHAAVKEAPAETVNQTANGAPAGRGAPTAANPVRIVMADGQSIYRVGMRKIFAVEDDIRVVAQAENYAQALSAAQRHPADVMLLETAICPDPSEAITELLRQAPALKIVLVLGENEPANTIEYIRRGAAGIVNRAISPELLVRCIRKVWEGESWLDKRGITRVFDAYRAQAAHLTTQAPTARLTEKELLIISGVTQGMRNKEIAYEIGTTEQVVKNYLRKVYDKLGVADRLELALYCVHHQLLKGVHLRRRDQGAEMKPRNSAAETGVALAAAGKLDT
ncbi:MAG: response regulator transcription factor [Acidobacteria bacterium]|nr:response regulator transcription factor [Acidobacteriota bacterium]